MKHFRPALAGPIVAAGLVTLLASSLTEEQVSAPPVPVTVNYSVQSPAAGLSRELATRRAIVTGMRLAGSYEANSGDGLTLDRAVVDLDTTSAFDLEIIASGDELLTGAAAIDITSTLDFDLDGNPAGGRFSSVFDGTTTIVDVTASGVDLLIGNATNAVALSWSDFVAREDDADAELDQRMASAAYNMLSGVLRAVLIVEDIVADTEANRTTLQNMGLDSALEVTCDNLATDQGDPPQARLTWTLDATGAGQGELGVNDSFEARYRNCRDARRNRYLDGAALLSNYVPDRGAGLRTLNVQAELRELYNAETVVDFDTTPAATAPLYDGIVTLTYSEVSRDTAP